MTVNKLKRGSVVRERDTAASPKRKKLGRFKVLLGPVLAGLMTATNAGCFSDPGPVYGGQSTDSGTTSDSTSTSNKTDTGTSTVTETASTSDSKTDSTGSTTSDETNTGSSTETDSSTETPSGTSSDSSSTTSETGTTSSSSEASCENVGPDFFDGLIATDAPEIVGGYTFVYKGENVDGNAVFDILCAETDAVVAADTVFPEGEITTLPVPADGMQIHLECFTAGSFAANVEITVEPL